MKRISVIALLSTLAVIAAIQFCMKVPSDPGADPNNVFLELFVEDENPTAHKDAPRRIGLTVAYPQHIDSIYLRTSCGDYDTACSVNGAKKHDTLFFYPVFTREGPCTVFVNASLYDDNLKDKTDKMLVQVLAPVPKLTFLAVPADFAALAGKSDTLLFVATTGGTASSPISFSAATEPSLDSAHFHILPSGSNDTARIVFSPDTADSFVVTVHATAGVVNGVLLADSAKAGIKVYKAFAFSFVDVPQTLVTGTADTLVFIIDRNRPDALTIDLVNKTSLDPATIKVLESGGDSLLVAVTPAAEGNIELVVRVSNGVVSDTTRYALNFVGRDAAIWNRTTANAPATEGQQLSIDLRQYLITPVAVGVLFSSSIGSITADTVWQWTPQWGCDSAYTATIIAKKDSEEFTLKLMISVTPGDLTAPAIGLADTSFADKTTGSSQITVDAIITDVASGVSNVTFTTGTIIVDATVRNDSIYSGIITGLSHGKRTEIIIAAHDRSMNKNRSEKKLYLTYDSTMEDNAGPQIVHVSGPKSGDRVTKADDTLVYSISDDAGVDSVWWTLNGSSAGTLTGQANGNYQLPYSLKTFGNNRIVIHARDGSTDKNRDSLVITLNYNTKPTAIVLTGPADKETGVDTLPTFTWSGGVDADGDTVWYRVCYGTAENNLTLLTDAVKSTSYAITAASKLAPLTGYYWQVVAWSKVYADTVKSVVNSFTTLDPTAADIKGPSIAQQAGPATGSRVTSATGTITVTVTDPNRVDSVYVVVNGGSKSPLTATSGNSYSFNYSFADYGTNKVVFHAKDKSTNRNRDSLAISVTYNTTIGDVAAATPANNATAVSTLATFTWTGGDDADGDTVYYRVLYGKLENSLNLKTSDVTAKTATIPSGDELEAYIKYYWQVVAFSKAYPDTIKSNVRSFTTAGIAPSITVHPVSDTINEDDPLTLSVTATGTPSPAYQWYKNGDILANETGATYSKASVTGADSGEYYVKVNNGVGSGVQSTTAKIAVRMKPRVTGQPENRTVTEGTDVSFTVAVTGTTPLHYQWQRNSSNITGQTNATYSITAAGGNNNDRFRCIISNDAGSVTSNEAVLTVNLIAPVINSSPQSSTVFLGSGTSLTVAATGTDITYQWQKNGIDITGETGATLTIAATKLSDNGIYKCKVSNSGGDRMSGEATLTVKPRGMRLIPGGTFMMGEVGLDDTAHLVTLTSNFWMDSTEVTQENYTALMQVNPSIYINMNKAVHGTTWFDAVLYCNARTKATTNLDTVYLFNEISGVPGNGCQNLSNLSADYSKNGYRLPTEAEWEYACRAGTVSSFYWGKNFNSYPSIQGDSIEIGLYAVWYGNAYQGLGSSHPKYGVNVVGSKAPNAFGLYDMIGNVWEWCNNGFYIYYNKPEEDPFGLPIGQSGSAITRGSSWSYKPATSLRSAFRDSDNKTRISENYGFRVVLPDRE